MSSSVMNGAIGKNPLIDKMNQLKVGEIRVKTAAQMEQQIYGGKAVKYSSVPVTFSGCRQEIKKRISSQNKE